MADTYYARRSARDPEWREAQRQEAKELLAEREGLRDGGEGWNFWIRGTSKSV